MPRTLEGPSSLRPYGSEMLVTALGDCLKHLACQHCRIAAMTLFQKDSHNERRILSGRITGEPAMRPGAFVRWSSARLASDFDRRGRLRGVRHSVAHGPLQTLEQEGGDLRVAILLGQQRKSTIGAG